MSVTSARSGNLSIHTENIFPIIKKFLYSNQEVFLRELVSNGVDATQKLRTLAGKGEFTGELGELSVEVIADEAAGTLTIRDRGIGMTADEVERYINQIAFSSAEEFLDKYKDAENIIGHFGLGFYSAFMVASRVELVTRSWQEGAEAVRWSCTGDTTYEMAPAEKADRGTDVILYITEDDKDYLKQWRLQEVLRKYCRFLPVAVKCGEETINAEEPLWTKSPSELKTEDYEAFYRLLNPGAETPLFWIHLNVDYPFNLTGILYFPKLRPNVELPKNKIHLYSNRVFITDNVEDVMPDYLNLMHGVIDSPDIPLNVSRSYLQTDANVRKIANHISKKVADKLVEIFRDDREGYQQKWESVGIFVKYGMLRDNNFYDRVKDVCLVYDTDHSFYTFDEYKARVAPAQTDKDSKIVLLYATDTTGQYSFIDQAKRRGYQVLLLDGLLDTHFIQFMEHRLEGCTLVRVDAGTLGTLVNKGIEKTSSLNEEETTALTELYKALLASKPMVTVKTEPLEADDMPVTIVQPEHSRRLKDMAAQGMLGTADFGDMYEVVLNTNHPLAKRLLLLPEGDDRTALAQNAYDLARLAQHLLEGKELADYLGRAAAAL